MTDRNTIALNRDREISSFALNQAKENSSIHSNDAIFQSMDSVHDRIIRKIPHESIIPQQSYEITRNPLAERSHKNLSRRLLEISQLVGKVVEDYILTKKDDQFNKKWKIKDNVQDQKSWKGWQATSHGAGAFFSLLEPIGDLIGGGLGGLCKGAAKFSQPAVGMVNTIIDGKQLPLSHEQSIYINSVQTENQATEGLKKLNEQLSNNVREVSNKDVQAFEKIAQH